MNNQQPINFSPLIFFVLIFSLALLLPKITQFINYISTLLNYPFLWALTENENTTFALRLINHQPLYTANTYLPILFPVYPPIYYLTTSLLSRLIPFSINLMRSISLISLAVIIVTIFLHQKTKLSAASNLIFSSLLTAIFLGFAPVSSFYPLARTDLLSLSFVSLSFLLFFHPNFTSSTAAKTLFLASLLLSIMTKQSNLILLALPLLAALVYKTKFWFRFTLIALALFAAIVLLFHITTQGNFTFNVFTLAGQVYGSDLFSPDHALNNSFRILQNFSPLVISLLALVITAIKTNRQSARLTLAIIIATTIATYKTAGNIGAGLNSFLLLLLITTLTFKSLFTSLLNRPKLILFVSIALLAQAHLFVTSQYNRFRLPSNSSLANSQQLVTSLTQLDSPILADRADYYLYLAGKEVIFEASTFSAIAISPSQTQYYRLLENYLTDQINSGAINSAIIGSTGFSSPTIRQAITNQMTLVDQVNLTFSDTSEEGITYKIYSK